MNDVLRTVGLVIFVAWTIGGIAVLLYDLYLVRHNRKSISRRCWEHKRYALLLTLFVLVGPLGLAGHLFDPPSGMLSSWVRKL